MICKNCGKEFETKDKRVKNCDKCRNKKVKNDEAETVVDVLNQMKNKTDELRRHLEKAKRRLIIKMIAHYIVHILEISAILALFIVK